MSRDTRLPASHGACMHVDSVPFRFKDCMLLELGERPDQSAHVEAVRTGLAINAEARQGGTNEQ